MTKAEATDPTPPSFVMRLDPTPLTLQPDLREAPRAILVLRCAKLICPSGEYVCLIRDVSSSGVRLRLFHALPPGTAFSLEMANGQNYPMEHKWAKGDQAGFQFAQPIDIAEFTEETGDHPRRPIRLRLECHGQLFVEGRNTPMVMRNISQGGACIETTSWLALQQTVRLAFAGLPECFAQVRWRDRANHGLAFAHAFTLAELAALAKTLQPFRVQPSASAIPPARASVAHLPLRSYGS